MANARRTRYQWALMPFQQERVACMDLFSTTPFRLQFRKPQPLYCSHILPMPHHTQHITFKTSQLRQAEPACRVLAKTRAPSLGQQLRDLWIACKVIWQLEIVAVEGTLLWV